MSDVNQTRLNSYDEVPYHTTSHVFTHPDNLATAARLLGLNPAPVTRCRVLELGCAGGGNLIPMALELPDSEFVGIDASAVQIADGNAAIAGVGCRNITLKQLDILNIAADFGQFDYIIVHGIFSWVPVPVRDQILEICRQNLTPDGIAYVSYNTYPGWHMLGNVREMMLYHTRQVSDPRMRIAQARELLTFLTKTLQTASERSNSQLVKAYAGFLQSESEHINSSTDSYVYHEELEEINDPIYFHEFAAWAARHNLQYLCEANFSDVFLNDFPPEITNDLLKMSHDLIDLEQYMDFLRNRTFRKTLLVHQDVPISRQLRPDRVQQLYVATNARSASPAPDIRSISVEEFSNPEGLKFATDHPVTKAALQHLVEIWPQALPFADLLEQAYIRLGQPSRRYADTGGQPSRRYADTGGQPSRRYADTGAQIPESATRAQDTAVLSANLLKGFAYSGRLIELRTYAPQFAVQVSERPVASPWARYQIQSGSEVTNLCHVRADLKGIAQYVLSHLDGTNDRAALLAGLEQSVNSGALILQPVDAQKESAGDKPTPTAAETRHILLEEMDEALQGLAHAALLIA